MMTVSLFPEGHQRLRQESVAQNSFVHVCSESFIHYLAKSVRFVTAEEVENDKQKHHDQQDRKKKRTSSLRHPAIQFAGLRCCLYCLSHNEYFK